VVELAYRAAAVGAVGAAVIPLLPAVVDLVDQMGRVVKGPVVRELPQAPVAPVEGGPL